MSDRRPWLPSWLPPKEAHPDEFGGEDPPHCSVVRCKVCDHPHLTIESCPKCAAVEFKSLICKTCGKATAGPSSSTNLCNCLNWEGHEHNFMLSDTCAVCGKFPEDCHDLEVPTQRKDTPVGEVSWHCGGCKRWHAPHVDTCPL